MFGPNEARRSAATTVTFEPGARTAWHTLLLEHTLTDYSRLWLVQKEGGAVEEVRLVDVVCFEPNEKHWHGATEANGMTHISIKEKKDGKVVY